MKNHLRHWAAAAVGAAAALAFSSCAYDPYYSSAGGYYSSGSGSVAVSGSGYGYGYGYGGSHFDTTIFVSTGSPRWGYDPYCYSYFDYERHCYYDPYLNGYYPVGYRPVAVVGCPHPYGWSPGRGHCPPPRVVNNVNITNYSNRETNYRNTNYSWSRQVRQQTYNHNTNTNVHNTNTNVHNTNNYNNRPTGSQPPGYNSGTANHGRPYDQRPGYGNQGGYQNRAPYQNGYKTDPREQNKGRQPADYNKAVNNKAPGHGQYDPRNPQMQNQPKQPGQTPHQSGRPGNQPPPQPKGRNQERPPSKEDKNKPPYNQG